ncbi:branched-chain amino acid ABC transporter permease [Fusibacillus kribbianus]|uniref:Branched-chain amino acid ABC transporter permease n=1 Tax=Fusibacillus kribbianus TaxID=3044208 RepID=A0AAP4F0Q2_9FIRM|nr:branched-chain amino acid ABC transporter permease [Ruminococcus sp. YH-rum2234]MDI9242248.1 branched-chain amino acid ABC transporter permease [Ruminococcus sp. YH-rum2234]
MFFQQLFNGITIGATYSLVAVGFSIVYSVLELVNFAHGSFYVLAGYLVLTMYSFMALPYPVAILASLIVTGLFGAAMNKFLLEPIRKKTSSGESVMTATLGVSTFILNLIMVLYGSETKPFPNPMNLGKFYIGSVIMKWNQVIIAIAAIIMIIVMSIIIYKTKIGSGMRAIAQDVSAAKLMGVNTELVITFAFFSGILCAAIAGILVAMYYGSVDTTMYLGVSMKTFAAALLGGIGSLPGAALGGIIIGVLEAFVAGYISADWKDCIAFIVLILVLLFRPSGLFGHKEIKKV